MYGGGNSAHWISMDNGCDTKFSEGCATRFLVKISRICEFCVIIGKITRLLGHCLWSIFELRANNHVQSLALLKFFRKGLDYIIHPEPSGTSQTMLAQPWSSSTKPQMLPRNANILTSKLFKMHSQTCPSLFQLVIGVDWGYHATYKHCSLQVALQELRQTRIWGHEGMRNIAQAKVTVISHLKDSSSISHIKYAVDNYFVNLSKFSSSLCM